MIFLIERENERIRDSYCPETYQLCKGQHVGTGEGSRGSGEEGVMRQVRKKDEYKNVRLSSTNVIFFSPSPRRKSSCLLSSG